MTVQEANGIARQKTSLLWSLLLGWTLVKLLTSNHGMATAPSPTEAFSTGHEYPIEKKDRGTQTPMDIPAQGWKDIVFRIYANFNKHHITSVAAGVTFYALLAIFPAIAALVSIYGLFADAGTIQEHMNSLAGFLPGGAIDIIGEQIKRIAGSGGGVLGFGFFIGLAISLWSANAGMKAIFEALNFVYEEDEKRSFIRLNAMSLGFTLSAILFLLSALAVVVVIPIILNFVGFGQATAWTIANIRWPLLLIGTIFGLALIYRYGPSNSRPRWRWISVGSITAALLWIVGSMLFSWYVSHFGTYNKTYGSLGAAIGFMTWIWLSTIIILLGAEINAQAERQPVIADRKARSL